MKEKWNKNDEPRISDGQPIAKKWNITEPIYKPKLLTHSPSLRAIRNYNDLPIDNRNSGGIDNGGFESEYKYEYYTNPDYSGLDKRGDQKISEYDYPTMSTTSRTSHSGGSEVNSNSEHNEMGSSVKLVSAKVEVSCKTWCSHISSTICTLSMATGLGNLYRLPQTTLIRGGLPFLVIYAILTVIIGLPLLFLELGIGQMAQEGFIKSWRAVPFFKGVGYIKLLAGCLLCIYYPLYMGLAILYLIWIIKGPVPFKECASRVVITDNGYYATTKTGQECLRATFVQSPFEDPYYFGIYAALLLFIWIAIIVLSITKTKSYIRSLIIIFFPTMACYIALTTKSILLEAEFSVLYKFFDNVDWSVLESSEVWYYSTIQVFFSTNIGFGSFVTNAGIMYNKVNPLWTALGYIITNLIFGTGSVIISSILTGHLNVSTLKTGDVAEVQLFALVYDSIINNNTDDFRYWMIATYLLYVFAGFISMATLTYTLLKAIYGHDGIGLKWWQTSVVFSFTGFVLGFLLLLRLDFDLVHLLDHYIVGNLILISVVIEVLALITFYGTTKIQSDFEFMLGHILSKTWLFLWWFIPILITAIFAWGLATLPLEGILRKDPVWLYAFGWAVLLTAFIFIIVMGVFIMRRQDGYTVVDKLKASLEPSHNWGPKDPMLRHNWIQWNSQSQSGERDFTLKRRGTKDYTKTIKKKAKKEASELSAMSIPGAYFKNDNNVTINNNIVNSSHGNDGGNHGNDGGNHGNANDRLSDYSNLNGRLSNHSNTSNNYNRVSNGSNNYQELYYVSSEVRRNIENGRVLQDEDTSLVDIVQRPKHHHHHHHRHANNKSTNRNTFPADDSPHLSSPVRHSYPENTTKTQDIGNDENSEGYGTFRNKGPYIIDGDIGHVCYRKYSSEHEGMTEL